MIPPQNNTDLQPDARIWIHSDLQLAKPSQAQATLSTAVDDILHLQLALDAVWCLGDAHCGANETELYEVARINIAQLHRLNAPVYYVLGNHEMDLTRKNIRTFPLHELAQQAGWHVANLDEFYFCAEFGNFLVVFMGDHAARPNEGNWWTSHGHVNGDNYPHISQHYAALRQQMEDHEGPVIIASHYAFPGGQRPSDLMGQLLPLPPNVRLHMHGHAHIGDLIYNKEFPWRRENPIKGETIRQFNISALESLRSPGSHSLLLELYKDGAMKLRFRDHLAKQWVEEFDVI